MRYNYRENPDKSEFYVPWQMSLQSSTCILRRLVPGPPRTPKSVGAQVLYLKWWSSWTRGRAWAELTVCVSRTPVQIL